MAELLLEGRIAQRVFYFRYPVVPTQMSFRVLTQLSVSPCPQEARTLRAWDSVRIRKFLKLISPDASIFCAFCTPDKGVDQHTKRVHFKLYSAAMHPNHALQHKSTETNLQSERVSRK